MVISMYLHLGEKSMTNRCILIFPQFENVSVIDEIRKKYDPNYLNVPPHITLVFPFESNISKEQLLAHVKNTLHNTKCFCLKLGNLVKKHSKEYYLMLEVTEGSDKVKELHEKLYEGILANFKPSWPDGFMPHMTIGQFGDEAGLEAVYNSLSGVHEQFSARICKVSVEIIGSKSESIIEFELPLPDYILRHKT